jgi:hypothetical protein
LVRVTAGQGLDQGFVFGGQLGVGTIPVVIVVIIIVIVIVIVIIVVVIRSSALWPSVVV